MENKDDFKTLYDNACYLFLQGKYRHAAKIFLQAAEASPSENGAIVSLVSAAECSLAASDNRAFIEIRDRIDAMVDDNVYLVLGREKRVIEKMNKIIRTN